MGVMLKLVVPVFKDYVVKYCSVNAVINLVMLVVPVLRVMWQSIVLLMLSSILLC